MRNEPGGARRSRRGIRLAILIIIVVVILVPLAIIAVLVARFDPNAYKPEIAAAAERAIGRKVSLNGPLSLGVSLIPTISAANVAVANPPGFARPEMARLARLDAKVALLPLLSGRVEIRSLNLIRPDIALEINSHGDNNFALAPPAAVGSARASNKGEPGPPPARGSVSRSVSRPVTIEVRSFAINDGTLSWQDDRSGRHGVLLLRSFTASATSAGAPLVVAADADYGGIPFTLAGTSGPLARLSSRGTGLAWPLTLRLAAGSARLALEGSFTDPAAVRGYRFRVQATVPQLQELAPLVPALKLPALNGITATADLADTGNGRPEISDLTVAAGASDLSSLEPGLKLASLSVVAPQLAAPCKLAVSGTLEGAAFTLAATLGPPAALLPPGFAPPPPVAPWPIAVRASAGGAQLSVSGTMAHPIALAGANLALSAQIPDLAKLDPFAGRHLPQLSQISFSGQIADAENGWRQWTRLSALALTLPEGDLAGDAGLSLAGKRPVVTASLSSKRLDLDALSKVFAAARSPTAMPPPAPTPAATTSPGAPPAVVPHAAVHRTRLIPDTHLPFALLNKADAELSFAVGKLVVHGAAYMNVDGKISLKGGKLVLAPFAADAPGGHVTLTASADAAEAAPPVMLTLDAPALALQPLLASFGLPGAGSGTIAVRADLEGAGNSPHAIAAGLNGKLGIAMAGGSVDNRVLADLFGPVLRSARVPPELLGNGTSQVRCLAVRIDAKGGEATLQAGLLEMARLTLTTSGSAALGPETLALHAVPTLDYRNNRLSLPVRVGGTFLAPKVTLEAAGTARSAAGVAGDFVNPQSELGRFLSALRGGSKPVVPDCAPALAEARFGASGPGAPAAASAPAAANSGASAGKKPNPLNLLRGLFR